MSHSVSRSVPSGTWSDSSMLCVWGWGWTLRLVLKARVASGNTEQTQKKILLISVSITHLNAHVRQYKVPHLKARVVSSVGSGKGQIRSHLLRDYFCIYSNMSSATVIVRWGWQQGSAKHRQNIQRIQICQEILCFLLIPPLHFRCSRLIFKYKI